jgi:hypothetical protein
MLVQVTKYAPVYSSIGNYEGMEETEEIYYTNCCNIETNKDTS